MPVWECEKCGALISYEKGKVPEKCSICGSQKGRKTIFKKNIKPGNGFEVKM